MGSNMEFQVNNAEQTQALAQKLATYLKPQDLILLDGDLGAGKTTFTKGLAKGLGIKKMSKVRLLLWSVNTMKDVYRCIIWTFIV